MGFGAKSQERHAMSDYIALYRKWRPSVFADVVGQDHITKVLRGEIIAGSVSHAYLFCGSRGTGKTTCAKILSKAVNCESPVNGDPCGKCERCLAFDKSYDIVEMDAASNNSVDDIRSLCDKISFMPIEMKKRVYIVDEVHMLSDSAFNALLKTLEEPPAHAMFILATTELNEIPATILSRCKRFDFHRISPESMVPRLRYISDSENIGITDDALRLIAFLATGAMRDALSMLELFVGQTDVDREKASAALGIVGNAPVLELLRLISDKNTAEALIKLEELYNASKDLGVLCSELAEMFRNLLVVKYASDSVSKILDADPDVIAALRDCEDKFTKERLLYSLEICEQTQNKLAKSGLSRKTLSELMIIRLSDSKMSTSAEALLERISDIEAKLNSGSFTVSPATSTSLKADVAAVVSDTVTHLDADTVPAVSENSVSSNDNISSEELPVSDNNAKSTSAEAESCVEMMAFGELLDMIKPQSEIVYSMLANSYADICKGDILKIYVNPIGHLMLNDDAEKKAVIEAAASKLLGMAVKVVFVKTSELKKKDSKPDLEGF